MEVFSYFTILRYQTCRDIGISSGSFYMGILGYLGLFGHILILRRELGGNERELGKNDRELRKNDKELKDT